MRLISNEELVVVSGGVAVAEPEHVVIVTGTRLSWWEVIGDYISDFFGAPGGGDGLTISQYNNLQSAYAQANASGSPVTYEVSSIPVTFKVGYRGAEVSAQFGGNKKEIVTVKPAGANLPIAGG